MKVGILGAPGSGKTKVAKAVAKELNLTQLAAEEYNLGEWSVVDGYVERLEKRRGRRFESPISFKEAFQIIGERWTAEEQAASNGASTITCGTLYETIIYAAFQTLNVRAGEQNLINDQIFYKGMMEALGLCEMYYYDYDAIFWLPYSAKTAIDKEHTWDLVINEKIPELLTGFYKNVIELTGTDKEKTSRVIEVSSAIYTTLYPASVDEPTVRQDSSTGEGEEYQSTGLSDV